MKNLLKVSVLGLLVVFLFTSCAKMPEQEMNDARAAIEATTKEGADIYAAEGLKKLKDDLSAATDEVATQSKKFFKNYGNSKKMLAKVKEDAEALKATIPGLKEKAKNDAIAVLNEAKAVLDEAKALVEKAPKGKGTRADIEAFKADLKGLDDLLSGTQQKIDGEDYFGASDTAKTIKEKAAGISDQIKKAMEKVKKR